MTGRQQPEEPKWKAVERERRRLEAVERQARRTAKLELERVRGQRQDRIAGRLRAREHGAMAAWREQRDHDAQEPES